jgi:anti-sigma factor ChrR (cupin superfamily)
MQQQGMLENILVYVEEAIAGLRVQPPPYYSQ